MSQSWEPFNLLRVWYIIRASLSTRSSPITIIRALIKNDAVVASLTLSHKSFDFIDVFFPLFLSSLSSLSLAFFNSFLLSLGRNSIAIFLETITIFLVHQMNSAFLHLHA
ncbi:hypothetical protein ACB092_12G017300 [Castanea dentata]